MSWKNCLQVHNYRINHLFRVQCYKAFCVGNLRKSVPCKSSTKPRVVSNMARAYLRGATGAQRRASSLIHKTFDLA